MKKNNRKNINADDLQIFKQNLVAIRKKKGMTQTELGQKMGVSQRVISYYENETENITFDAITALAKALDVPRKKLLDTGDNVKEPPKVTKALQKRIDRIKDLSPKSQKTISDMIDALTKAESV